MKKREWEGGGFHILSFNHGIPRGPFPFVDPTLTWWRCVCAKTQNSKLIIYLPTQRRRERERETRFVDATTRCEWPSQRGTHRERERERNAISKYFNFFFIYFYFFVLKKLRNWHLFFFLFPNNTTRLFVHLSLAPPAF